MCKRAFKFTKIKVMQNYASFFSFIVVYFDIVHIFLSFVVVAVVAVVVVVAAVVFCSSYINIMNVCA